MRACVRVRMCVCARARGGGAERNYYVEMNKYVTKVFPPRPSLSHTTHFTAFFPLTDLGHFLGQRLQYLTDSFFMPENLHPSILSFVETKNKSARVVIFL